MTGTSNLDRAVEDFRSARRIAVAGFSRSGQSPANFILKRMESAGQETFAVNPAAPSIEGRACYPDLRSIPGGVDAVFVATPPAATEKLVRECADLGIRQVWVHRALGRGSCSPEAAAICRECGISLIDGACPLMYYPPVDFFHRCFRTILRFTGGLPRPEGQTSAAGPGRPGDAGHGRRGG